jgi:hypothetical protein
VASAAVARQQELNAQIARGLVGNLHHDRFDLDLGPADVEPVMTCSSSRSTSGSALRMMALVGAWCAMATGRPELRSRQGHGFGELFEDRQQVIAFGHGRDRRRGRTGSRR